MNFNLFNALDVIAGIVMFSPFQFIFMPFAAIYILKGGWTVLKTYKSLSVVTLLGALDAIAGIVFYVMSKGELLVIPGTIIAVLLITKGVVFFLNSE